MAHVFLVVEGQAEERYFKTHFAPVYYPHGVFVDVTVMPNKRGIASRTHRGGRIGYDECVKNIRRYLRTAAHCELVALVYDYYGLDPSFTTNLTLAANRPVSAPERAAAIRQRLEADIDDPRFHFFVQLHEFEAYLFCRPDLFAAHHRSPALEQQMRRILADFNGQPEAINDGVATAPSKRIEQLLAPRYYAKTTDGVAVAGAIGVADIREQCPAFDAFCQRLDRLR